MDKSFDLVSLMKNHEKKHKNKPTHFLSVAKGVQKRLDKTIKYRKSSRLSIFDSIRNLPPCDVPEPISESQKKVEHRRMQLEKWKEEKEKKKKDAAAQKRKPFVAGIAHPPLKYVPPPPPKPMPSTSGRVTRSQSSKANSQAKNSKVSKTTKVSQSFAPSNASFKPPELKNSAKFPTLAPIARDKKKNIDISFDPVDHDVNKKAVLSNSATSIKQNKLSASKSNTHIKTKKSEKPIETKSPIKSKRKISLHRSVSNSDNESSTKQNSVNKNKNPRKSKQSENQLITLDDESSIKQDAAHKNKTPKKSKKIKNQLITPKNMIPKSESSSEERLRSPKSSSFEEHLIPRKSLSNTPKTPEQIVDANNISPCVTLSRGKDNARKEMKKKMEEGLLDDDTSNMDNVDYFRCQLDSEVKRITEMCDTWEKISQQVPLAETAMEMLLGAVGQGRLLVSQKLAQFGSLVAACARPEPGAALVTPADLHGFWDMVFMQVENVDMRFKKLEELRARNWVEEHEPLVQKRKVPKVVKNNTKPAATSRLRDLIAAARKAKKEKEPSQQEIVVGDTEANSKTFEAGFFCVRSPVKSPQAPATPSNKASLLKAVLSSEAKKASASKNSASLAMLRASFIGKNVDNSDTTASEHLTVPKTPINLTATPARSILKSTNVASTKRKSGKKSIKVVLFNDSDVESQEVKEDSFVQSEDNEKLAEAIDSGLSSMDLDKEVDQNKENVKRKTKLIRQNALDDRSPVLTRSRRKSMNTPLLDIDNQEDRRRSRGRAKEEDTEEKTSQTPKRSTRRKKNSIINISNVV